VNGAAIAVVVGVLKLTFTACLAYGTSTATLVGPVARREGRRQGGALRGLGRPRACHLRQSIALLEAAFATFRARRLSLSQAASWVQQSRRTGHCVTMGLLHAAHQCLWA
jgi:hypothetical protein